MPNLAIQRSGFVLIFTQKNKPRINGACVYEKYKIISLRTLIVLMVF